MKAEPIPFSIHLVQRIAHPTSLSSIPFDRGGVPFVQQDHFFYQIVRKSSLQMQKGH
jgi:hypothetical protein